MLLKVCGLREKENVNAVAGLLPQLMGFIFVPSSSRYFFNATSPADLRQLPEAIKKVGVFVNETDDNILKIHSRFNLQLVQLHGDEPIEFCRLLHAQGIRIIKVFRVHDNFDFTSVNAFAPFVEYFLFDTAGKEYGGNGTKFNHSLLQALRFARPLFLSGGIGPDDTAALKAYTHNDIIGVDVNSRFETAPAVKDVALLKLFKQQLG